MFAVRHVVLKTMEVMAGRLMGPKTQELLVNALNSQEQTNAITAPLVGDTKENSKIANNYIEIDLKDQKNVLFH